MMRGSRGEALEAAVEDDDDDEGFGAASTVFWTFGVISILSLFSSAEALCVCEMVLGLLGSTLRTSLLSERRRLLSRDSSVLSDVGESV